MPRQSLTKPETWQIAELEDSLADVPQRNRRLELPRFQRSIVWDEPQQRDLIASLQQGYPIGSLLLYERGSEAGNVKRYLLVDGLQRTTAIRNYLREPLNFASIHHLSLERLEPAKATIQELLGVADAGALNRAIDNWMVGTRTLRAADGYSSHGFLETLASELQIGPPDSPELLYEAIDPLLDEIREQVDIRRMSLPIIIYEGDESHLPDIFERINARGTALSKYDIYAASWVDQETRIENTKIRDAIDEKYEELLESGYSIHGLEQDGERAYSLFEYLFGLGKVISQEYPRLFSAKSDPTETESIGFTLVTVVNQMRLAEMPRLPGRLPRDPQGRIDPSQFEEPLFDAINRVDECLRPFLGIALNRRTGPPSVGHTEYQIASLIARALAGRFVSRTWEERRDWEEEWATMSTSLPQHYLYDILLQNWRGSGDTRLFDMTWREEPVGTFRLSAHYSRPIPRKEWDEALGLWFREQTQREQRSRPKVRAADKVFLRYVYSGIVSYLQDARDTFELEHLYPVSRLRSLIRTDEPGWPISSVANLALFDWILNREKSKLTIREYLERIDDDTERGRVADRVRSFLLCEIHDVEIPRENATDVLTREQYESFLIRRYDRMKSQLYENLGIG